MCELGPGIRNGGLRASKSITLLIENAYQRDHILNHNMLEQVLEVEVLEPESLEGESEEGL